MIRVYIINPIDDRDYDSLDNAKFMDIAKHQGHEFTLYELELILNKKTWESGKYHPLSLEKKSLCYRILGVVNNG